MKLSKRLLIIVSLLITGLPLSCINDNKALRIKNWKILYDQDKSLQSVYGKKGWENVEVPSTFKLPYPPVKGFQYVWMKSEFDITGDPSVYYGISFGRIFHTHRVYINKEYTGGSLSYNEFSNVNSPKNYNINHKVLKKGRNEIYINLGVFGKSYGGILDEVKIRSEKEHKQAELIDYFLYTQVPLGVVFFFLTVITISLIALYYKKEKFVISTILMGVFHSVYILSVYSPYNPLSLNTCISIQMVFLPVTYIFGCTVVQIFYEFYISKYNMIFIPILCVLALLMVVSNEVFYSTYNYFILLFIVMVIFALIYIIFFYFFNFLKRDNFEMNILFIVSMIYGVSVLVETVFHFSGMLFPRLLITNIAPVATISFVIVLARNIERNASEMNRQLEKKILEVSENERGKIGMELHDGLGHDLLEISMKIGMLADRVGKDSSPVITEAEEIEKQINKAIKKNRSLAKGLSPVDLEEASFVEIVDEFKRDLEINHNIQCIVEIDKAVRTREVVVSTHIYLIIREAVRNIIRHSRAEAVKIKITSKREMVTISIMDNGIGISKKAGNIVGMGMSIMNYRAKIIGAKLRVRDVKQGGTEVICRFSEN